MLGDYELNEFLDKTETPFLLILDNVTDVHNLGACLRSCDGAGVNALITSKDKSASLTAAAKKQLDEEGHLTLSLSIGEIALTEED